MVIIKLDDLGDVEVGKKLKANINITAKQLFEKFPDLSKKLSRDAKQLIIYAINKNEEPKLKKHEDQVKKFFEQVKIQLGQMGFSEEESEELTEAEELEGEEMDEADVSYEDGQETFDEDTGKTEGEITLDKGKTDDTNLVPIIIEEQFEVQYEHDGTPLAEGKIKKGVLRIDNVSEKDRLWDIDLYLENISQTDLAEETIILQELDPAQTYEQEYSIDVDVTPELKIEEFISTVDDPDMSSYSLAVNVDNEIYFNIKLTNTADAELKSIELTKTVAENIQNMKISSKSTGDTDFIDGNVVWKIDSLGPNAEATMELRATITIDDKNTKVRSGTISAIYESPLGVSGLDIAKFDAYTNNAFSIMTSELEEEPNAFECQFIFENKSDYMIRLVNADVFNPDDEFEKYVDIDPNEIPEIPAGGKWTSNAWNITTEDDVIPKFKTKVEFHTVADHQISTKFKLNYADLELAVAALEGLLSYDIERIPSFQVTSFNLTGKVTNTGGADLNEVTLIEKIQPMFLPPKPDEVKILVNGDEISIPGTMAIEPDDDDATKEHVISIKLENLKDTDRGALKPGEEIVITYPITAQKPSRDSLYKADATLTANTYPPGKPIVVEVDPIEIEVVHIRKKVSKSKSVQALETEGEYEIILTISNMGEFELDSYELTEKVSSDLILWDVTHDPEIVDQFDYKVLTWKLENVPAGESVEIKYKIKPAGESKVSESQESE
ncbi:MAG: hypothetical protein FK733_06875 [Asgard group archaeon]|nr:hypothetical protein [Asgard group archaeon]